jgi:hypothetical protein
MTALLMNKILKKYVDANGLYYIGIRLEIEENHGRPQSR